MTWHPDDQEIRWMAEQGAQKSHGSLVPVEAWLNEAANRVGIASPDGSWLDWGPVDPNSLQICSTRFHFLPGPCPRRISTIAIEFALSEEEANDIDAWLRAVCEEAGIEIRGA